MEKVYIEKRSNMKELVFTKKALVIGENALDYLKGISYRRLVIVTGGSSMEKTGVIDKVKKLMKNPEGEIEVYSGIQKNPTDKQITQGVLYLNEIKPDVVIALGGGSSIDAAKVMILLYEYPQLNFKNIFTESLEDKKLKTLFIAIPSTSGTASEVTHVSVVTMEDEQFKMACRSQYLRPDIAILDGSIPQTLPQHIVAETGMDALTHALEAYINKTGDDFTYALAKEAIEGLIEWLPVSYEKGDLVSRTKVHHYQCMAGMAFSNSGLGIVHGVSHAFGGKYNLAHGLINAIILPYSMDYNKKDPFVIEQYARLSKAIGRDIVEMVKELNKKLHIALCVKEIGIEEIVFKNDYDQLVENAMKGSTKANPITVSEHDMEKFVLCVYYGKTIDF